MSRQYALKTTDDKTAIKPLYKKYSAISSECDSLQLQLKSLEDNQREAIDLLFKWCVGNIKKNSALHLSENESCVRTVNLLVERYYSVFADNQIQKAVETFTKAESDYQSAITTKNELRQEIKEWSANFKMKNGREPVGYFVLLSELRNELHPK